MKNVYALLLILLAVAAGSNAQTLQSYTAVKDTTPNNLPKGSIWFVSEDSGSVWIAGDSALVAKADTSDLSTWSLLNSGIPSSVEINWLEFVNTSIIFAAGGNGAIYKTTDGGNSWNVVYYNASLTNFIDRITFFTATHGFAWGDGISSTSIQACLETTDGGSTWTNNNSQLVEYASSQIIRFVPPSNVYLTGGYDITFTKWGIWRSTDAGHNWSFSTIGTSAKDSVIRTASADFKNNLVGVACRADSTFWSTSDGGVTWQQIGSKTQTRFFYVQFVNGTNTAMAGGVGQASIAAIDLDASTITVFRDATKSTSFGWVNFPTLTRGYMSHGIQKTFYSVKSSTPLPVELTSFDVMIESDNVILRWHTATEVNNYGFDIERKITTNPKSSESDWEKIGFAQGSGTSNRPHDYLFTDKLLASGRYIYRLKQTDNNGAIEYSKELEVAIGNPKVFMLSKNYPNPFNPSTTISYTVPEQVFVKIGVYDMLGRQVATLVNEQKVVGEYSIPFNASNLASGLYIYRMQAGKFSAAEKFILMK
jgi:photosystem II stability/assembly factor-like uncharacterized protein